MKKSLIAIVSSALILSACGADNGITVPEADPESGYPVVYQEAALPQYPNAEIISDGLEEESASDGIRIKLETADSVTDVVDYFTSELSAADWTAPAKPISKANYYYGNWRNGDQSILLTVDSQEAPTSITIVYTDPEGDTEEESEDAVID